MSTTALPEVPTPGPAPENPATITRWTHRHPCMEVRTRTIRLARKLDVTRTEWRPEGVDGAPWLPVNIHDLARGFVEVIPPTQKDRA